MQQPSAVHAVPCRLAKVIFFVGVIAILRYSDILPKGLATTATDGLHQLTQELWMFCR
jgi:hypothetical protein